MSEHLLRLGRLLFDPARVEAVRFYNTSGFPHAEITLGTGSVDRPTLVTLDVSDEADLKALDHWVNGHHEVPTTWGGARARGQEQSAQKQPGQEGSRAANRQSPAT